MSAPLLAGHPVRIRRTKTVCRFDGIKREWFRIDVDYPKHSHLVVMAGGKLEADKMLCADHGLNECDCKKAIRNYLKSEPT